MEMYFPLKFQGNFLRLILPVYGLLLLAQIVFL